MSFVNGRATFTRLRINEISNNVLLQLSTKPGNLQVSTTTPLSAVPPPSTTPRVIVHFKLAGEYSTIEADLQGFVNAVKRALATALDVDMSRLQDIKVGINFIPFVSMVCPVCSIWHTTSTYLHLSCLH